MPRMPSDDGCRRYRRVAVTYTVAREHVPPSWPTLRAPRPPPTSPASSWPATTTTASISG